MEMAHSTNSLTLKETEFLTDLSNTSQWISESNIAQNESFPILDHLYEYDIINAGNYGFMNITSDLRATAERPNNESNTHLPPTMCQASHANDMNNYNYSMCVNTDVLGTLPNNKSSYNDLIYPTFNINANEAVNTLDNTNKLSPRVNMNNKASYGIKKPKRIRTAFTTEQIMQLEQEYTRVKYLERNRRLELSHTLCLSERTIKVWFQNRRMKEKKDRAEEMEESEATSTSESSPERYTFQLPPNMNNYQQNSIKPIQEMPQEQIWYREYNNYIPVSTYSNEINLPHNLGTTTFPNYLVSPCVESFNLQKSQQPVDSTDLFENDSLHLKEQNASSSHFENVENNSKVCLDEEDLKLSWEIINELSD